MRSSGTPFMKFGLVSLSAMGAIYLVVRCIATVLIVGLPWEKPHGQVSYDFSLWLQRLRMSSIDGRMSSRGVLLLIALMASPISQAVAATRVVAKPRMVSWQPAKLVPGSPVLFEIS